MTRPRYRAFDVSTAEKLSVILAAATENGLAFSFDFLGPYARVPGRWYIAQLFDLEDRCVVSGRGKDPNEAVAELLERWLAKGLPG